jgi:hypothetical protein
MVTYDGCQLQLERVTNGYYRESPILAQGGEGGKEGERKNHFDFFEEQ